MHIFYENLHVWIIGGVFTASSVAWGVKAIYKEYCELRKFIEENDNK
jgi:hypothetical protein